MRSRTLVSLLLGTISLLLAGTASGERRSLALAIGQSKTVKVGEIRSVRLKDSTVASVRIGRGGAVVVSGLAAGATRVTIRRRRAPRLVLRVTVSAPGLADLAVGRGASRQLEVRAVDAWVDDRRVVGVKVKGGRVQLRGKHLGATVLRVSTPSGRRRNYVVSVGIPRVRRVRMKRGSTRTLSVPGLRRAGARFYQVVRVRRRGAGPSARLVITARRAGSSLVGLAFSGRRRQVLLVIVE